MTSWISKAAIEFMAQEADRCYPFETGGVIAGYVADNGDSVIRHAFGPGPNATHRRSRFLPDHEWQCSQLDRLFDDSAGKYRYLGDWHTHPDATGRMSWRDHLTLRVIARHPEAHMSNPLMVIGGGTRSTWEWLCHQYKRKRLLGVLPTADSSDLRVFSLEE